MKFGRTLFFTKLEKKYAGTQREVTVLLVFIPLLAC